MSKLFHIYEDDLVELEKSLPAVADSLMEHLSPRLRTQLRRCKDILSNVRWNYGPCTVVAIIPAEASTDIEDEEED